MTERPTSEQIIYLLEFHGHLSPHLRQQLEGCVIVHPDDVPPGKDSPSVAGFRTEIYGWDACRDSIFGADR